MTKTPGLGGGCIGGDRFDRDHVRPIKNPGVPSPGARPWATRRVQPVAGLASSRPAQSRCRGSPLPVWCQRRNVVFSWMNAWQRWPVSEKHLACRSGRRRIGLPLARGRRITMAFVTQFLQQPAFLRSLRGATVHRGSCRPTGERLQRGGQAGAVVLSGAAGKGGPIVMPTSDGWTRSPRAQAPQRTLCR